MAVNEKMSALADAIREKTGNTESLTLDTMVTEIESIKLGEDIDAHNAQSNTHNALLNRATALTSPDENLEQIMVRGIYAGKEDMEDGVSYLPSGVIYLKLDDEVNLNPVKSIEFSVGGPTMIPARFYNALEGMTFKDWINSNYNVDNFYITSGNYINFGSDLMMIIDPSGWGTPYSSSNIIEPDKSYSLFDFSEY